MKRKASELLTDEAERDLVDTLFGGSEGDGNLAWTKEAIATSEPEIAGAEEGQDSGAAWEDEDDENIEVDLSRLKSKKLRRSASETVVSGLEYSKRLREEYA